MKLGRVLALAALVTSGGPTARAAPEPPRGCVTFVGDVTLARGVARELERRQTSPWAELVASHRLAPAWIGNFEGAVLPEPPGTRASCSKPASLCLGVKRRALEVLRGGPFRAFSIANNHIDDYGAAGHAATRRGLSALGIAAVDEATSPTTLDVDGTQWALVALNLAGNTRDQRQALLEGARLQIGLARAETARVVVLPHWGREGEAFPAPEQELWAPLLARWGATLIVGAHSHVVQPARCAPEVATYFGLGNHLFDNASESNREGLAVTCCPADGDGFTCTSTRTQRSAISVLPTRAPETRDAPADAAPACTIHGEEPDRRWMTHPARNTFLFVQAFPSAGPGTFFALRRHPSSFDHENALRPYVFRIEDQHGRPHVVDVWRGTSLARPLVAARLFDWNGGQVLCAIHRADTFLTPHPRTMNRTRVVYRWTGFGFAGIDDEAALQACEDF